MLSTKASATSTDFPVVDWDKGAPGKLSANRVGAINRQITVGSAEKNEDLQRVLMNSEYQRLRKKHLCKLFIGLMGRRVSYEG
jgi:hypothetical protein